MRSDPVVNVVLIPAGWFWMGTDNGPENEMPRHRVWLDSFATGRFPITNREFEKYVLATNAPASPFRSDPVFSDPEQPVVGVSWNEAVSYCEWLSARTRENFRLPTEAERERAARGNEEGFLYPWGDELPSERPFAGYDPTTGGPERVGLNSPNGFGLYNMSEGVHEWCSDYYDADYYRYSPEKNPHGPAAGERRVSRGGSWRHRIKFSRCAARSSLPPAFKYADYGFRLALSL
jgi:formylglycine-generating enzyme required for sulfatase activity